MKANKEKYVVVDDNPNVLKSLLGSLSGRKSGLSFHDPFSPDPDVIECAKMVSNKLSENAATGVVLDLRLDECVPKKGKPARYLAQTLAQALRTDMANGKCLDVPIVLWSISQKFKSKFSRDILSHDLFDACIVKDPDDCELTRQATLLSALSNGYRIVRKCLESKKPDLEALLVPPDGIELDRGIWEEFQSVSTKVAHRVSMHIRSNMLDRNGPLVSTEILSARLGIEIEQLDARSTLSKVLKNFEYSGPFSEISKRWWWSSVLDWWKSEVDNRSPLYYTSSERVRLLREKFGGKSKFVELNFPKSKEFPSRELSLRFSTVCLVTKRPLDPVDGFLVARGHSYPWQDEEYVCEDVVIRPSKYARMRNNEVVVSSLEKERVDRLKAQSKAARGKK
ncbi:hypothetical protein [Pelagicoccus sp. SDUM812002]|uniref:hypothetical protein n=1 Tax=Pelagicoccus sp. SDUM812002 TaxID=3041266 RepID=UPI0028109518|nr:hypothetical protein [Pelagicoccus sp. SDUM812002]MDQ8183954.1 hypothetical protein [Pelagicoccus sp. SDUM812002]